MANYKVSITNGSGSQKMQSGDYTVTVTAEGYDATTLTPATYSATDGGTGAFTLSANGTLTLIFNDTGAEGGSPVTSGTVVMTDQSGTQTYGSPINIGADGSAVFDNVPFYADPAYTLYFSQTATDEDHEIYSGVITVSMSQQTQTQYVENLPIYSQTITLTDANYSGLPVASAEMTFEK
ncbi:MAG: hypothetical protein J6T42_03940 [Clostridia bacterium]|nr:hypothetical protein [Clostridia bacterium]